VKPPLGGVSCSAETERATSGVIEAIPMPYEFFLSYTRSNNNDTHLNRFFEDLSDEIRDRRGLARDAEVGFFDQRDIELGETWDARIAKALQASKVMVCIYSPSYFKQPYCGKEWTAFYERCEQSRRKGTYASLPPLIKPVLWIPLSESLAPTVADLQYLRGNAASNVNRHGLKYVLQQVAKFRSEYIDYVRDLAIEIMQAARDYPLPPMRGGLRSLAKIRPYFPKAEGKILPPRNRERLAREFSVEVALSAIPSAHHVWIAVQVGNLFWPKDPEVPARDENWICKWREDGPPGKRLSLALLMVEASGHKQIESWVKEGKRSGEYGGFTKYPVELNAEWLDVVHGLVLH
jgi:TIR domain-containing protein